MAIAPVDKEFMIAVDIFAFKPFFVSNLSARNLTARPIIVDISPSMQAIADFFLSHPYLLSAFLGLPAVVLGFIFTCKLRRMMLWSGLLMALFSPLSVLSQKEYWTPIRLGRGPFGIEDVMVSFSLGSLIFLAGAGPVYARIKIEIRLPNFLRRFLLVVLMGTAVFSLIFLLGAGSMLSSILTYWILTVVLLLINRNLWWACFRGAFIYSAYYCAVLYTTALIAPRFFGMWDGYAIWGPRLLGLPVEDIIWVLSLTVCYLLIVLHASKAVIFQRQD